MKVLDRPTIGLDGSYVFTLKDYEGVVIAQVTSINPQQECSVGDYIDEATAEPKCLGNNTILSSTVLKVNDNKAILHTTTVTTIATLKAGIKINEDGTIAVDDTLSPEIIDQSNKTIARVLKLGDQSVAEYTPKSIITTDQKFQSGDAYSQALAEISGIEAEGKSLDSIVKLISAGIGKNGKLSLAVQDMMVKGNQQVFKTAKEQGADSSILELINKRQDMYPDSNAKIDLVNAPKSPAFTNKIKTTSLQPTWEWRSGDEGNRRYRYIFGSELNFQSNQDWKEIETTTFTPDGKLTLGKYRLEIQEGHKSESEIWSVSSKSIIEIVANQKGSVSIVGQALEDNKLVAIPTDKDGIQSEVTYQWYRDNQLNNNATNSVYVITEEDVDKTIKVQISYIDNIDFFEKDIKSESYVVVNVNEERFLTKKADHLILEEDSETKNFPIFAEGTDNLDKNITYLNNNSEIANVVITDKNKLNITPIENQHGESIITVTSTSNGKEVKRFFYLVISNVNDQPKITSTPNLKAKEVELYKYQVKTTDDDSQLFSYSISSKSAITKDMKIDANGLITWMPPNRKDSYLVEVEVVVNDNSGADNATDKQRFEIYVEAINDPPVLQW
ncbi:hypothetical protein N9356_00770 [Porticoccaceae bacterium]|nr:hypothetical protein [Porticoccaceae bacterium]